ncbi:hypothetical protein [Luteimonas sp. R10]|uniref:hypothetical protein n=1 Tax=Luteimonas sp. R10 TaxID=3108176 RepID=UPI003086CFA0|nr:hypothetical protein U3649_01940 [Luteimonas sp. R10]
MRLLRKLSPLLLVPVSVAACGGQPGPQFLQPYFGDPYLGEVRVRVDAPEEAHAGSSDRGRGSAHFMEEDGKTRFVVAGSFGEAGDAGFTVDGAYEGQAWVSESGGVRLEIGPDGTIAGGGIAHPHRLEFSGNVSETRLELDVDLETLEANPNGLPAGTRFAFHYDLERGTEEPPGDAGGNDAEAACNRIEWRLKNVPNLSGGAMGLVRVPVCRD